MSIARVTAEGESVIIIGGGVIGIACAHYLNDAGYRVTVIDQGAIADACSYGNCGFVCPSHLLPIAAPAAVKDAVYSLFNPSAAFRVRFRFDRAFLAWMWKFLSNCNTTKMIDSAGHLKSILESSLAEYRNLLSDDKITAQWKKAGLLYVLKSDRGMQKFAQTDALLTQQFGVKADRIDGSELSAFDPSLRSGLAGAFHYADDAHLRPDQLNSSWVKQLTSRGVRFVENCRFQSLETKGRNISEISTTKGTLAGEHFVLATGALSAELASHFGQALPIEPGKGYSVTMELPKNGPKYPMLLPEHHVGVTPFEDGLRLGSMMEFVGFDDSLPTKRLNQLRHSAEPYLACKLPAANLESWFGWRPMTPDGLPIIGGIPRLDNAMIATGHNMLGMTLAPATGKLVAELIGGEHPHINPHPFSPTRFH